MLPSEPTDTPSRPLTPERALRTISPTPPPEPPARFQPWPENVKERCRDLWATVGNGNAGRVAWLYSREVPEGTATPAASTIRMWARDEAWEDWANAELSRTQGRTLYQLQVGWLRALQLSQEVQLDILAGMYDDNPAAAAVRAKVAESVQRMVAQSGLLAVAPTAPQPTEEETRHLSVAQQSRMLRDRIAAENSDR